MPSITALMDAKLAELKERQQMEREFEAQAQKLNEQIFGNRRELIRLEAALEALAEAAKLMDADKPEAIVTAAE